MSRGRGHGTGPAEILRAECPVGIGRDCEALERRPRCRRSASARSSASAPRGQSADLKANADGPRLGGRRRRRRVADACRPTFNPNGTAVNLTSAGNRGRVRRRLFAGRRAQLAHVVTGSVLVERRAGLSAVAVDPGSGISRSPGSFSGTVKFGTTTLSAPSADRLVRGQAQRALGGPLGRADDRGREQGRLGQGPLARTAPAAPTSPASLPWGR